MQSLRPLLGRPAAGHRRLLSAAAQQHRPRPQAETTCPPAAATRRVATTARPRRKPATPKTDVPLYEIPPAVLDLDAEDNPHVRPYDEAIEAEETAKWRAAHASIDALAGRLAAFAQDADRAEARMRAAAAAAPGPWRVTDRDIWAAALLGVLPEGAEGAEGAAQNRTGGAEEEEQAATVLRALYERHGITPRVATEPSRAISFLLHRQSLAKAKGGGGGSGTWDTAAALTEALDACQSFVEVRRLLVLAAQTPAGCRLVAQAGPAVAARLSAAEEAPAAAVSTLLLNLSWAFASQGGGGGGADLGPALCALGLQAAAASGEPAAVARFLGLGLAAGHFPERAAGAGAGAGIQTTPAAVLSALSTLRSLLQGGGATDDGGGSPAATVRLEGTRAELFCLLTGQDSPGGPSEPAAGQRREVSFRAALSGDSGAAQRSARGPGRLLGAGVAPEARAAYLAVLAELGGVRTLWAEQHGHGPGAAAIDAQTLTTGVLRYATYCAGTAAGGRREEEADDGNNVLWQDLCTIRAYEAAATTAAAAAAVLPTQRPAAVWPAAPLPATDEAFRARVVEAFARETADEAVAAIQALLAQPGGAGRAR